MEIVSACPVCASGTSRKLGEIHSPVRAPGESFTVHHCVRCCLRFLSPRPAQDELSRYYPRAYFRLSARSSGLSRLKALALREWFGYPLDVALPRTLRPFFRLLGRLVRGHIGRQIPRWRADRRLLEIGCGSGNYLAFMEELGWRVSGLDPSPVAIDFVVRSHGIGAAVGLAESLPYKDSEFDVVVLHHVIEHVRDPRWAVAEIRRVLKPGGVSLFTTPNGQGLGSRLFGLEWVPLDPPVHLAVHSPRSLRTLLESHGLDVLSQRAPATNGASVLRHNLARRFGMEPRTRTAIALSRGYELLLFFLSLAGFKLGEELQFQAVKPQPIEGGGTGARPG